MNWWDNVQANFGQLSDPYGSLNPGDPSADFNNSMISVGTGMLADSRKRPMEAFGGAWKAAQQQGQVNSMNALQAQNLMLGMDKTRKDMAWDSTERQNTLDTREADEGRRRDLAAYVQQQLDTRTNIPAKNRGNAVLFLKAGEYEKAFKAINPDSDWQTFESGNDVYRYDRNNSEATPQLFHNAPDAPIEVGGRLVDPKTYQPVYEPPPDPPEPFTLSPGQQRFGPDGRPLAGVPSEPPKLDPFTLSPGQTRYGPDGRPLANLPAAPEFPKSREVRIGNQDVTQEWDARTGKWFEVGRGDAFRQGPDTVINTGENAYAKERGGAQAKVANELDAAGRSAQADMSTLKFMETAIAGPSFYSGFGASQLATVKRIAVSIGIADPGSVVDMESFNALAKQQAINSLGGSLGTGFSNADRSFVLEQIPNLDNTPEGNRALIAVHRKFAERKMEIARMARAYERKHGQLDADFEDELVKWAEANPLFKAEAGSVTPSLGEIENELKRRGLVP